LTAAGETVRAGVERRSVNTQYVQAEGGITQRSSGVETVINARPAEHRGRRRHERRRTLGVRQIGSKGACRERKRRNRRNEKSSHNLSPSSEDLKKVLIRK